MNTDVLPGTCLNSKVYHVLEGGITDTHYVGFTDILSSSSELNANANSSGYSRVNGLTVHTVSLGVKGGQVGGV